MSETSESLRRKIDGAAELESVVRTMKALAAASITQYERAVHSLDDYYRTVELGLVAWLHQAGAEIHLGGPAHAHDDATGAVVFGSDQGLVGQFNDVLADLVIGTLHDMPGNKNVLAVGERVRERLADAALPLTGNFAVPNSITAITALVGRILVEIEAQRERGEVAEVYLFHNRPKSGALYEPVMQRLLPLDATWRSALAELPWPTGNLPEVIGRGESTLQALLREYLFISLFRACAESLASENASRLAAMQRAEKNIDELLEDLNQTFHRQRQSAIDEELFDVIAGFEALRTAEKSPALKVRQLHQANRLENYLINGENAAPFLRGTTMSLTELNQRFAISNHVQFKEIADGIIIAEVSNQHANSNITLQGAHIATWQPRGQEPVIWLSPYAKFAPGKSIRGGVPICWPWFGPHATDSKLPGHGYARTVMWEVLETKALTDGSTFLRFGLIETDATRAQWLHASTARLEVTVGKTLRVELVTQNNSKESFILGEALHTYFQISDVAQMTIRGLEGCDYLDKVGEPARRTQQGGIVIESEVDRVYVDTEADCVIEDKGLKRAIRIAKQGSRSTVVWNPWTEKANKMGDFGDNGFRGMVCVESANAFDNLVTVKPGETHRLVVEYSVEAL